MINKMLVDEMIGFQFVSTQKCKISYLKGQLKSSRKMSVDMHAVARVRAPTTVNRIAESREPYHSPRTLDSFGRRSPSKIFVDKIPNTAKYPQDNPTRNLLGAGEMTGRMTKFSRTPEFIKFLNLHFTIGPRPADNDDDKGNSFFHAVNMCLNGHETVNVSVGSQLRAMAFEDKGELDMLRTLHDDLERNFGVPVTSGITPSALAKKLGICITVFRTVNSKNSENSSTPRRLTYSGDAGQCAADREIFLFKNEHGFQSLLPKKNLKVDVWNEFWRFILA